MWHLTRPNEEVVATFLRRQQDADYSYAGVGASRAQPPPGYDVDHNRIQLGVGEGAFRAACDAIRAWRMFPPTWTRIYPPAPPILVGTTVALRARACGLWWLSACRIVYTIDEPRRFGFAYGTLPGHVESGEERFSVEWREDDSVWYDLRAFSRPRYWLVRLFYPIARRQQRRFVRDSQAAMVCAVKELQGGRDTG